MNTKDMLTKSNSPTKRMTNKSTGSMCEHVEIDGVWLSAREISKKYGLSIDAVYGRMNRGMRGTDLTKPPTIRIKNAHESAYQRTHFVENNTYFQQYLNQATLRAEDMNEETLKHICMTNTTKTVVIGYKQKTHRPIFETIRKPDNWYDVRRIMEYFDSDTNAPLMIAGMRGIGKTLVCRAAFLLHQQEHPDTNYTFVIYKKNRRLETIGGDPDINLNDTNILVVDDLHYLYDDIEDGKQSLSLLLDILEIVIRFTNNGGRAIVIAEDIMAAYPIEDERFEAMLPYLEREEFSSHEPRLTISAPDLTKLLETYGIYLKDSVAKNFVNRAQGNPRGVINLLQLCDGDISYQRLMDITRERFQDKDYCYKFLQSQLGLHGLAAALRPLQYRNNTTELRRQVCKDFMTWLLSAREGIPKAQLDRFGNHMCKRLGYISDKKTTVNVDLKKMFVTLDTGYGENKEYYLYTPLLYVFQQELHKYMGYKEYLIERYSKIEPIEP